MLFDAEHFFDGFALDRELRARLPARGRRRRAPSGSSLCDTNGGSLPPQIRDGVRSRRAKRCSGAALGIHTPQRHAAAAVANSLAAVEAGATQVQGTINGIGERTGNANLVTIIADLQLKMGCEVLARASSRA